MYFGISHITCRSDCFLEVINDVFQHYQVDVDFAAGGVDVVAFLTLFCVVILDCVDVLLVIINDVFCVFLGLGFAVIPEGKCGFLFLYSVRCGAVADGLALLIDLDELEFAVHSLKGDGVVVIPFCVLVLIAGQDSIHIDGHLKCQLTCLVCCDTL